MHACVCVWTDEIVSLTAVNPNSVPKPRPKNGDRTLRGEIGLSFRIATLSFSCIAQWHSIFLYSIYHLPPSIPSTPASSPRHHTHPARRLAETDFHTLITHYLASADTDSTTDNHIPNTAQHIATMAQPSPSYVPRASRPSSPAVAPTSSAYVPRSSSTSRIDRGALTPRVPLERKSSGLRNEMKRESTQEAQEMSEDAKRILKVCPYFGPIASHVDCFRQLLSNLPAPLPESLPSTFLPSPSASPRSTSSSSPPRTFTEYVHLKRKQDLEPDESYGTKNSGDSSGIGLGLGLSVAPDKKRKVEDTRGITPSSPMLNGLYKKDKARSGLRNEVDVEVEEGEVGGDGEERVRRDLWKPEKWSQMGTW